VEEQVEVTALVGTLSDDDGEAVVHAHAELGRRDRSAITGHVQEAVVRPTLEPFLRAVDEPFPRVPDAASGLDLIRF
jgi:hypothetical protein